MMEFDSILRNLVDQTGIPLKKLAEALGVSSGDILAWRTGQRLTLNDRQIDNLATFLGINSTALFDGSFDQSLVRRRVIDGPRSLPDRYIYHAHSRVRTSAHIVDFLTAYFRKPFTDKLLTEMNIHPCYFDNLDNPISLTFLTDLFLKLRDTGFGLGEIQGLAHLLPVFLSDTEFGRSLADSENYEDLYTRIMRNIDKFDCNFDYKTQINRDGVIFEARPTEITMNLLSATSKPETLLRDLFFYRQGLLERFPYLIGAPSAEVVPLRAAFEGDNCDRYWVKFPDSNRGIHAAAGNSGSLIKLI